MPAAPIVASPVQMPQQLIQDTLNFLVQQPWGQVNGLVQGWIAFSNAAAAAEQSAKIQAALPANTPDAA